MGNYNSDKQNARFFGLKLSRNTDAELIERLEAQENVQSYLKQLIRNDMKGAKTMKTYRIKPEYLAQWGEDATEETILTEDDIETITRGWEKTPEDVADQLIPENFSAAVELMDDEIREAVHSDLAPCSEARFLMEYSKRHLAKYGEEFKY